MTDAGDILREIQQLISAIVADLESDQLPLDLSLEEQCDLRSDVAYGRPRTLIFSMCAGGLIAGLAVFLVHSTRQTASSEMRILLSPPPPRMQQIDIRSSSEDSEHLAVALPSPPLKHYTAKHQMAGRLRASQETPATERLASESNDQVPTAPVSGPAEDGPTGADVAGHLTGKALEDALSADRMITQRLNNAALNELKRSR